MFNTSIVYVDFVLDQVSHLDIDYLRWVIWLVYPIIISFLLPLILLVLLYGSAIFLILYRQRHQLRDAYAQDFWDGARKTLAAIWEGQGRIWHGYELVGIDKLPTTGAALIIYYHGVIPIDIYYLMAKIILERGQQIRAVGDRFLFRIPGWRLLMEVFHVTPGTVQSCVDVLKEGHVLAISPGGVREALFGDEYYQVMWARRTGFAKVALQAKVPVIPMFTENLREAFRTPSWGRSLLRKIYEKTRLPIVPIYGLFPVKLRTHFGEPIYPTDEDTPETFAAKAQVAVEKLIGKHQRIPGNILIALLKRIPWKWKTS